MVSLAEPFNVPGRNHPWLEASKLQGGSSTFPQFQLLIDIEHVPLSVETLLAQAVGSLALLPATCRL